MTNVMSLESRGKPEHVIGLVLLPDNGKAVTHAKDLDAETIRFALELTGTETLRSVLGFVEVIPDIAFQHGVVAFPHVHSKSAFVTLESDVEKLSLKSIELHARAHELDTAVGGERVARDGEELICGVHVTPKRSFALFSLNVFHLHTSKQWLHCHVSDFPREA